MTNDSRWDALIERLVSDDRVSEKDLVAFESMRAQRARGRKLTAKQGEWIDDVARRLDLDIPTGPEFASGAIPRGREVPVPEVLRHLPKSPPGRRQS